MITPVGVKRRGVKPLSFTIKDGTKIPVYISLNQQDNGNLAIALLVQTGKTYLIIEEIIVPIKAWLPKGCGYLNTIGLPHIIDFVEQNKLGKADETFLPIDLVCPYYVFNLKRLKELALFDNYDEKKGGKQWHRKK